VTLVTIASGRRRTPRIGLVLDAFDASYQSELVRWMRVACQERRLELCVFPGGILGAPQLGAPQRNLIYRWITASRPVDGLVLLGSTIMRDRTDVQHWCERLLPLPLCSIGLELDGVPSILPDNQRGIQELVRHLVTDHGHTRLAFVGGPKGNQESCERLEAFRGELDELGLDGASAPYFEGDFQAGSGREAARELLARHPEGLDAIVAANDYMAMGILDVLSTRASLEERRIAVTGFDNVAEAAFTVPPLTTIQQPLRRLADAAVVSILAQLDGGSSPPIERLPTKSWLRRSCGCKEPSGARPRAARKRGVSLEPFAVAISQRAPQIGAELQRISDGLFAGMRGWDGQLVGALIDQVRGVPGDLFLAAVDRVLFALVETRAEVWRFHSILSALRAAALESLPSNARRNRDVEEVFHAARLMTGSAAMRAQAREHADREEVQRILNRMGTRLSSCNDEVSLWAALDETLPGFGLRHAFLMTLAGSAPDGTPRARLSYALGVEPDLAGSRATFDASELLPPVIWERSSHLARGAQWVVLPLFSRDVVLGYAVIELVGHHGANFEALRLHLSHALANALHSLELPPASRTAVTLRSAKG
jgi:phosphoserine phosphatase RsbU/P